MGELSDLLFKLDFVEDKEGSVAKRLGRLVGKSGEYEIKISKGFYDKELRELVIENFILRYRSEVQSGFDGKIADVLDIRKENDTIKAYHDKALYNPDYNTVQKQLRKTITLTNRGD